MSWRPFTDSEAWAIFRFGAWAEAFGWTLLIIGIGLKRFVMHGSDIPVQIAGRLHGTLFMLYILAVILTIPSLKWSPLVFISANAASVPPFGSIILEQILGRQRDATDFRRFGSCIQYAVCTQRI